MLHGFCIIFVVFVKDLVVTVCIFFQYNVSPELLQRMMEAREIFLEDDITPPFASIKQVTS